MTRGFALVVGRVAFALPALAAGAPAHGAEAARVITDADRQFWAFRPVSDPAPPSVNDGGWSRNEIDRFVFAKLQSEGLAPAPEADRVTLIRRATFDLHGLPPTPEDVQAFVADPSPDAYEKLVDRLLASPRYGERYARHWLDLVRYAESDGFKQDAFRPTAWRYRDWVIASLNADKPFDAFAREQLAGDELAPASPDARAATGFLRHAIYEYNQKNAENQWSEYLNDLTDVTADAFLGLSMGCARCHDHKFDPVLQTDYFRLRAFFAAVLPRNDLPVAGEADVKKYEVARAAWDEKTRTLREQIAEVERPGRERVAKGVVGQFPPAVQGMMAKPPGERSPYERQIAYLVERQVEDKVREQGDGIAGDQKDRLVELRKQLAAFEAERPKPPDAALCVTDVGPVGPPTRIPDKAGGGGELAPGYPVVLEGLGLAAPPITPSANSTGRRAALAAWLTDARNPLTTRVITNRLWQWHLGHGLVGTPSDFGRLGEPPTHPELLDWLTTRFVRGGWAMKPVHRLIMTSATYRQSAVAGMSPVAKTKDPENRLLWRRTSRRLDAEQVRDAMLAASGELVLGEALGPPVDYTAPKRSVFTRHLRNTRDPLLDAFDLPESFGSVCDRNATTTPTQSLLMMNDDWPMQRATAFARRVAREAGSHEPAALVDRAYRIAYGRAPGPDETADLLKHLGPAAGADIAKAVKLRKDAGAAGEQPVAQLMPQVGGQALLVRDADPADMLRLPPSAEPLFGDAFTVEAYVLLESLYDTADVRVIAGQWNGDKKSQPGWALGVTSARSQYGSLNLVLQIEGVPAPDGRTSGYEVIASNLRLELHKVYYVGAAVNLLDTGERGVTFWLKDIGDMDAPLRTAHARHAVTAPLAPAPPLVLGGRGSTPGGAPDGWDGLIGEVRLSRAVLPVEQILLNDGDAGGAVVGHWRFEDSPGPLKEAAGRGPDLVRSRPADGASAKGDDRVRVDPALIDLCHVLLNSNEFLYVD
jgi:hypothetical protein